MEEVPYEYEECHECRSPDKPFIHGKETRTRWCPSCGREWVGQRRGKMHSRNAEFRYTGRKHEVTTPPAQGKGRHDHLTFHIDVGMQVVPAFPVFSEGELVVPSGEVGVVMDRFQPSEAQHGIETRWWVRFPQGLYRVLAKDLRPISSI